MKHIIQTKRLLLRYPVIEDVVPLIDLWTDPEVTRFMGGPRNPDTLRPMLEEAAASGNVERYDLWVLAERASGDFCGHCGLLEKEVDGAAEIEAVYVITPGKQHRGYAPEIARALIEYAFTALGLRRVVALIDPEHAASERVALKAGMRFEKRVARSGGAVRSVYVAEFQG